MTNILKTIKFKLKTKAVTIKEVNSLKNFETKGSKNLFFFLRYCTQNKKK